MLEQGPVEQRIIEQCYRSGLPLPQRIQNAPQLLPGLEFFLSAWVELSPDRPVAMSEGFIPMASMVAFSKLYELSQEETKELIFFVRELDKVYIEKRQKDQKRDAGKGK